jgi:hypothetical protein
MAVRATASTPPESTAPTAGQAAPETTTPPGASGSSASQSASPPTSADPSQGNTGKNDWFRSAFNSMRYGVMPEAPSPREGAPESERTDGEAAPVPASAGGSPESGTAAKPTPEQSGEDTIALTQEELQRRIQSETDRRLAKHQREEAERRKREERRQLREKDPYAFAAAEREDEEKAESLQKQLADAQQMALSSIHAYDASVLDPLMKSVPDAERKKILDSIEPGIPGRGQAAVQALKVLEQTWKAAGVAEARKTLLADPTFVKEVLARHGGQRIEPDLVPAAAAPAPAFNMNSWMRANGARVRGRA